MHLLGRLLLLELVHLAQSTRQREILQLLVEVGISGMEAPWDMVVQVIFRPATHTFLEYLCQHAALDQAHHRVQVPRVDVVNADLVFRMAEAGVASQSANRAAVAVLYVSRTVGA